MPWTPEFKVDEAARTVSLVPEDGANIASSSANAIYRLMKAARDAQTFPHLSNWPGEKLKVLGTSFPFAIDRALAPYFGVISRGSHLNAFVRGKEGSIAGVWIAKRGPNKPMFAGMLDNAAAGSVSHDETPTQCIKREAQEELGLDARRAVSAGTISWFNIKRAKPGINAGLVEPGIQYVYDLEVPSDVVLRPAEAEIDWLRLLSVEEVMRALRNHEFKPSCASVMIDFFVRHGIVNAESDREFEEIVLRLHRKVPVPVTEHNQGAHLN